jgi:drug/metabolite transporter (DMT)-like permease
MSKKNKKIAILLAVVQALLFVLMGVWARFMNESFTLSQQVFWRMIIALIIAWVLFGRSLDKKTLQSLSGYDWMIYVVRSILYFGAGIMLFTFAVNHTTLGIVSFSSSLPIVGIFGWIMFRERIDIKALPFILLSIIGLGLLCKIDVKSLHLSAGIITALLSMVAFDISYLMVRYHKAKMTNFQNTTLLLCFAWIAPLVAILLTKGKFIPNHFTTLAVVGLVLSSILNVVNLYLLNYIFSNLKGYVAGNVLLLEGVFALIIGFLFYNESANFMQLLGAIIILATAYVISFFEREQPDGL